MKSYEFRAWNKIEKQMEEVFVIDFYHHRIKINPDYDIWLKMKDAVLMQYLYSEDCIGKKIFEKDIIKAKLGFMSKEDNISSLQFLKKTIYGEIKLRPSQGLGFIVKAILVNNNSGSCYYSTSLGSFLKFKPNMDHVVGNMFENPTFFTDIVEKQV